MDHRKTFDFYVMLCKAKKQPIDRKEFARWKKELDKVLSWLGETGQNPGRWLISNASAFSGRGYREWWVPLLKLKARDTAFRKRETEWEKIKRPEMTRPKKQTGMQTAADIVRLVVFSPRSKNGSGLTLEENARLKPPMDQDVLGRNVSSRVEGGEP